MTSRINRIFASFACALALVALVGCESIVHALNNAEGGNDKAVDPSVMATYFGEPKVRPGIVLAISVTATGQSGGVSQQYPVDAEGYISMNLVGRVKVDGLTLVAVQEKVAAAYKEYYLSPNVTAVFVYQPGQNMVSPWGTVQVLGEVHRQGPVDVPSTQDLRVLKALQLAGGVTSIADKRRVQVTRCDKDGKKSKTIVDLIEIGEQGLADKDMLLRAGDVVWVPMSWY